MQEGLALLRAARRSLRRLLLEAALPRWVVAVAVAAAFGCVLLLMFGLLPRAPMGGAGDGGDPPTEALRRDLEGHGQEHWRMLLPGRAGAEGGYDGFVVSMLSALRARPLGMPSLVYAMQSLTEGLDKDSLWLEFGVWMGHSINLIGRRSRELGRARKVFGFDSFKGLPEDWRNSTLGEGFQKRWTAKGAFNLDGHAPELLVDTDAVDFVVGWFNESLPPFLEREAGPITFVHIDSDLYSSAATVLKLLTPRVARGAVLVFDEIVNYPGFRQGEAKALYEWLESPGFRGSGLEGVQVIGYRGPGLLGDEEALSEAIALQRGEGRQYPQCAVFRVW